ncbi:SET domain-containing protein-lysine N-methyltransferase [Limnohabitans sp. T6-5]|uniref:SET domain-containing protein n=1 Tax=Limnohabitans sp. T6-5 TaxID=1100724 RepID=UPI000D357EA5|nr:SET domain-containing protein-lysine N-methyltransferase [Limnohabitans sp. T6-5]PUE06750.1 SET domain-containing protein-lysine N-methyltransferase [Limnohabitans sp. T6-5]
MAKTPAPRSASPSGKRIQVRRSGVHGKGVFALQDLAEGETIIEYVGEVISWDEAQDRHPHDPNDPNHTFYFHVNEDRVIDALHGGNSSRWINHSCDPNCEADEDNDRIFIKALRNIKAGEELNYDYGLIIDEPYTPELLAEYPCWCGAKNCRGTLLSPKERDDTPEIPSQKKKKANSKPKADVKKAPAKPKADAKAKPPAKPKAKDKASVKTKASPKTPSTTKLKSKKA